ncbi:MAG: hypothetical protein HY758_04360 [Nitrospirae bacterium]|nr:hypothetical protein [Nitrospirota bacterium]
MIKIFESGNEKNDYDISKKQYKDKFNLTWLMPFGAMTEGRESLYYSPVITEYVLVNFPVLPRVLNKLKGISEDRNFNKLIGSAISGDKIRAAAKDFLKQKKLI